MSDKLRDLKYYEKPREKMLITGPESLTDVELLAILLGFGGKDHSVIPLAREILNKYESFQKLSKMDLNELKNIKFIGLSKASTIIAALEIGRRFLEPKKTSGNKVSKPQDIYEIFRKETYLKDTESTYILSLDSRGLVISKDIITTGTINETLLSPREIFRKALYRNAVNIILVHNHPSGNPQPSLEDIKATDKVRCAGNNIGINLIDHIIITDSSFMSFKQEGLLNSLPCIKGGDKCDSN
ncbi:MAG TPA: DNA repair protein RadC [bacterium]|nr:DNA repair protein RadC [bacterium]